MILNNLDPAVAQFPQELVTYGGNGQVRPRSLWSLSRSSLVSNISANVKVKRVEFVSDEGSRIVTLVSVSKTK